MDRKARAQAIKAACAADWKRGGGKRLTKTKGNRRLVLTKEPDYIYGPAGEIIGVDAWVELYDNKGNEIPIDPHRRIINPPVVPRSGIKEFDTGKRNADGSVELGRRLVRDPLEAFYEAVWDSIESNPNPEGWRTSGTVTTVYSGTTDGFLTNFGSNTGPAGSVDTTGTELRVGLQKIAIDPHNVWQSYISFDTSAISDTDSVSAVSLDMWLTADGSTTSDFVVQAREYNWGPTLTTSDWVNGGSSLTSLPLLATLSTSTIGSTGAYKTFSSQAAFLTASGMKTGTVWVLLSTDTQASNNLGTGDNYVRFSSADASGTTQDPRLTITHSAGDPNSGGSAATVTVSATGGGTASGGVTPISFVGVSTLGGSGSLSEPTGCQQNDVGIVIAQFQTAPTPAAGWTQIGTTATASGWSAAVYRAQRGSTAFSLSWLNDTYTDLAVYRGIQLTPDASAQANASATAPSVTTTVAGDLLICAYSDVNTTDMTAPTGMTRRNADNYNAIADVLLGSAGATGTKTFGATSTAIGAWSIAFKPVVTSVAYSGGASTSVSATSTGAGRPGFTAGSPTTVSATSSGAGKPGFSGSSSASVSVGTSSGVSLALSGGSSAAVSVSTAAGGSPSFSGSAGADISVDVSGAGRPALLAGASADVVVDGIGDAVITVSNGSGTSVTVSTNGSGLPGTSGGSVASVNVTSTGDGNPGLTGGSTTSIDVTAVGSGSPAIENGVDANVMVTSTGGGTRSDNAGGSVATITTSATGAGIVDLVSGGEASVNVVSNGDGSASLSGGSDTEVSAEASGAGFAGVSDGSNTSVITSAAGEGSPNLSGGEDTAVVVSATGGGHSVDEGGSTTAVIVSATGGGIAAFSSGSAADVEITTTGAGIFDIFGGAQATVLVHATGRGLRFAVDITVTVGPSRVRERAAVVLSRILERTTVNASTVRERVSVRSTRQFFEADDSRIGNTVQPSRVVRGA